MANIDWGGDQIPLTKKGKKGDKKKNQELSTNEVQPFVRSTNQVPS